MKTDPDVSGDLAELLRPLRGDESKLQFFETYLDPRMDLEVASRLISNDLTPHRVVAPHSLPQLVANPAFFEAGCLRVGYAESDRFSLKLRGEYEKADMEHSLASAIRPRALGVPHPSAISNVSVVSPVAAKIIKRDGKIKLHALQTEVESNPLPKHLWGQPTFEGVASALASHFGAQNVKQSKESDSCRFVISDLQGAPLADVVVSDSSSHISCDDSTTRRAIAKLIATQTL